MLDAYIFSNAEFRQIYQCTFDIWQPQFGDPNFAGWATVGIYLVATALGFLAQARACAGQMAMRLFWATLTVLMFFLAVNKQLDLQSIATTASQCISDMLGWWENRQRVRFLVIVGLGLCAISAGVLILWFLRNDLKRNFPALLGLAAVFGFVLVRAVMGQEAGPGSDAGVVLFWAARLLELAGPLLISLNAVALLFHQPENPPA